MSPTLARLAVVLSFAACSGRAPTASGPEAPPPRGSSPTPPVTAPVVPAEPVAGGTRVAPPPRAGEMVAVFAGGCFWCMEAPFERLEGVREAVSGYTGGDITSPTYDQVSAGATGHYEAVRVVYDPTRVTYEALLDVFVHNVDPTDPHGQFCDHGPQYRAAVFVEGEPQRAAAAEALARAGRQLGERIVVEVLPAAPFYVAESYHQDFYRTHERTYAAYRQGCGRDERLRTLWGEAAAH